MNERLERMADYVKNYNTRSAWCRGVTEYGLELLEKLNEDIEGEYFDLEDIDNPKLLVKQLLNGASDWKHYSRNGCSLIYNHDIANRLCTPSELKRTRNGKSRPNKTEEWLDTQARALYQASLVIKYAAEYTKGASDEN